MGKKVSRTPKPGNNGTSHAGAIKVRVPTEPDYQEMFGATAERLWASPTERTGVYRIDNIPMYTQAVRCDDLVRVSTKADPPGVHDLTKIVGFSGHATFHVIVAERDPDVDPEKDPALAPLWKAWRKIDKLGFGCTYEGDNSHAAYVLAIDAPPGTDLDAVRTILDKGEAAKLWGWAGGALRDADPA